MSRETADKVFKRQEESIKQMRDSLYNKLNMFSSEHFKIKFKHKISPSDQKIEKQEEELICFKVALGFTSQAAATMTATCVHA